MMFIVFSALIGATVELPAELLNAPTTPLAE